jgi:hypothetical protein
MDCSGVCRKLDMSSSPAPRTSLIVTPEICYAAAPDSESDEYGKGDGSDRR